MGLIYEVRNQIACCVIDNGKMNVITPQIHPQIHRDFYHSLKQLGMDMSRGDAVHHGQNLYHLHPLNDELYGSTEAFFADRQQ